MWLICTTTVNTPLWRHKTLLFLYPDLPTCSRPRHIHICMCILRMDAACNCVLVRLLLLSGNGKHTLIQGQEYRIVSRYTSTSGKWIKCTTQFVAMCSLANKHYNHKHAIWTSIWKLEGLCYTNLSTNPGRTIPIPAQANQGPVGVYVPLSTPRTLNKCLHVHV